MQTPSPVEMEKAKLENEILRMNVARQRLRFCMETFENCKNFAKNFSDCHGRPIELNPKPFWDCVEGAFAEYASHKDVIKGLG